MYFMMQNSGLGVLAYPTVQRLWKVSCLQLSTSNAKWSKQRDTKWFWFGLTYHHLKSTFIRIGCLIFATEGISTAKRRPLHTLSFITLEMKSSHSKIWISQSHILTEAITSDFVLVFLSWLNYNSQHKCYNPNNRTQWIRSGEQYIGRHPNKS